MFPQVFHHNYVVYKNVIQRGKVWSCMAAGRQRVDTQLGEGGGRESGGEDLEALSSNVHWKLEHLQSRMNTAYH